MSIRTAAGGLAAADVLLEKLRRAFIPFLRNELKFADFCTPGSLEVHGGSKSLRWGIFKTITASGTTALTEADATAGEVEELGFTTVTTTVAEYGAWAKIGSLADVASTRETRQQYAEGFGEHGARTIDTLLQNAALATTGFLVAQETATGTGTVVTTDTSVAQDIAIITGYMRNNNAKPFQSVGNYVVIINSTAEQDLVTDVTTTRINWVDVNKHVPGMDGQKKIIEGSPGAIYGTMILTSNNIQTATLTGSATAHANIALSRDAVGRAGFGAMTPKGGRRGSKGPQIITKRSGSQDTSNPLSMFSTLGWKTAMGQSLLESARALTYYTATG